MALKKGLSSSKVRIFKNVEEVMDALHDPKSSVEMKVEAIDYLIEHKELNYVLKLLNRLFQEDDLAYHPIIDTVFAHMRQKPKRKEDFEELFAMLKSPNAYLRNQAISYLQDYNEEVSNFIEELLSSSDRDVRIFAVNILGDAKLESTKELLEELLQKEDDINVVMTAVDYLGEIGDEKSVEILESLKERFAQEPYVNFGVDLALQKIKGI